MNARISRIGVLFLLLAVLLMPVVAQAAPEPQSPESEPNDTFYDASYVSLGHLIHGRIAPIGDIDMVRLLAYETLPLTFEMRLPESSPLVPMLTLYDDSGSVLEQRQCPRSGPCLTYQLPEFTTLYAAVSDGQNAGGQAYEYSFVVAGAPSSDPNEPNDFLSEATPYTVGQVVTGLLEPLGDIDTFAFQLEAGNEVTLADSNFSGQYFNAAGELLSTFERGTQIFMAPESGLYYMQITSAASPYELQLLFTQRPFYASFSSAGKLDGVAFKPGDILIYSPHDGVWRMYFRAADYGLKGNLAAFDREEERTFYLTYSTAQDVANVGPIAPHDVLRYWPGNPDWGQDPQWSLVLEGSPAGLTTAAERLDALAVESSYSGYDFHLSTTGRAQLPHGGGQWYVANNDVLTYRTYWQGEEWIGSFHGLLSGSANAFKRANVVGLDVDFDNIYLAFDRSLTLNGVPLGRGDIVACERPIWVTTCESFTKVFDASDTGVGSYKIDAIDVGVYETP